LLSRAYPYRRRVSPGSRRSPDRSATHRLAAHKCYEPSPNYLKVKTQAASEGRVRHDQDGGATRREHVFSRREIRPRCDGAHVAIIPYLDLDPTLRGISGRYTRGGVRRRILQLTVIFLLRNQNVTRGNAVVESTPRENWPRSLHGSRGMGIAIDAEYLRTPGSVAKASQPDRGPVQTLPTTRLLDVNSAVGRRLAERSDCEKDSKVK
jgi:hypothetical protein